MNSFSVYSIAFTLALLTYLLNWSDGFPKLSLALFSFIICTIIISLILGKFSNNIFKYKFYKINIPKKIYLSILILIFLLVIQIVLKPIVPLYMVLFYGIDNHGDYGTTLLHPLIMTYSTFLGVYIFHLILSGKNKKKLILLYLITLLPAIIFYSRGTVTIIILSSLFMLTIFYGRKLNLKNGIKLLVIVIVCMYLFGYVGNQRLADSQTILHLGNASHKYEQTKLPSEFFWVYMYIASPLGNFQESINQGAYFRTNDFIKSEMIPSILSKYLLSERAQVNRVTPAFTVGTVFARSFKYLDWYGPIFMYSFIALYTLLFQFALTRERHFSLTGLSILNAASLLSIFSNMYVETSIFLPLLYCVLSGTFRRVNIKSNKEPQVIINNLRFKEKM